MEKLAFLDLFEKGNVLSKNKFLENQATQRVLYVRKNDMSGVFIKSGDGLF